MLMLKVKHWSASLALRGHTVLVVVSASITGINCPLDLKVAFLINIIKDMAMTMNISTKRKVATVQSKIILDLQCDMSKH